jgi:hypothetical protein
MVSSWSVRFTLLHKEELLGAIFKVPGYILYLLGGIWGLFLCLGIIYSKLGFIGGLIAFFLLPFTVYLAPWYAGLVDGNWKPVLVVYGSGILAMVLIGIGSAIDRD